MSRRLFTEKKNKNCKERKRFKLPNVMNSISNNPSFNHRTTQHQQNLRFDRSGEKKAENQIPLIRLEREIDNQKIKMILLLLLINNPRRKGNGTGGKGSCHEGGCDLRHVA